MNIANGPIRPLPATLSPPLTKCFQITLPDDTEWQGAFFDALFQLTYWFAWARDNGHSGRIVAETWLNILATLKACKPEPPGDGCCDGSEDTLIRQNPDNPCLLESSADGIHWCTLFDQSLCTPENGQPGSGARQPADGGGEACYHADFPSTMQWNLPTVVNAGDVIEVKNTGGQATDAPNHVWYCPNGQLFFAGQCVSTPFTQGGDPAATANHMTIICQIAGVWYSLDMPLTVPGGITNAPVVFQINDGVLSDNSGGYSFDVCVTNNAATTWSHLLNFATAPHGSVFAGSHGIWTAGIGLQGENDGSTNLVLRWQIPLPTATHITEVDITYSDSDVNGGTADIVRTYSVTPPSGTVIAHYNGTTPAHGNVTNKTDVMIADSPATRSLLLALDHVNITGTNVITSLLVKGTGPEPVWP